MNNIDKATEILKNGGIVIFPTEDRKSTRLNSSHQIISYAVFCLKKKKINRDIRDWQFYEHAYPYQPTPTTYPSLRETRANRPAHHTTDAALPHPHTLTRPIANHN